MFEQSRSVLSIGRKDQPTDPIIWFVKLSVIILTAGTIISTYGTFKESHLICEFPDKFDSNVAHSVCSMKGTRSTEEFNQNENIVPIKITNEKQTETPDLKYVKSVPLDLLTCALIMLLPTLFIGKYLYSTLFKDYQCDQAKDIARKFLKRKKSGENHKLYKKNCLHCFSKSFLQYIVLSRRKHFQILQ